MAPRKPTAPTPERGKAAKPTALKVLHGDRKDRVNTDEPVGPEQEVAPPDDLSDEAREIWDRLGPSLIGSGVLTFWDIDAFAICCESLARYKAATKLVNGSALLVQGANGFVKNPALDVQAQAAAEFAGYAARFGLTPSDRTKLKVTATSTGPGAKQGAERLLS